jgi:hypothetical protein
VNQFQLTRPGQVRKLVGQPGAGQNPAIRRRDVSFQMPLQVAKFAIWIGRSEHFFLTFPVSSETEGFLQALKKHLV